MLTLKRLRWAEGKLSREDDFEILDEGRKSIGRIYLATGVRSGAPAWFWANKRGGPSNSGYEHSREEAMEAFKRAWDREL